MSIMELGALGEKLVEAGEIAVRMFARMKDKGWIDDETAIRLSFKFLGEILDEAKIKEILAMDEVPAPGEEEIEEINDEARRRGCPPLAVAREIALG